MVNPGRMGGLDAPSQTNLPSKSGSTLNTAANIKVVVRVRPLNEKETTQNSRIVIDVVDDRMLVFDPKEEMRAFFYQGVQQPNKNYLKRANKELKFLFDNVCGPNATNQDIFETATKDILASLMEGYNCSVFVYGATGAGKTFTMIGDKEHPGITYLTMEHLFHTLDDLKKEREFDIGVSYIEVYNENVYDLLKPSSTPLQLREDAKYGVMVAGVLLNKINTARELLDMLENGNKNRTQHPTDANAESSRSHAVFQVYVKMRYKTSSQCRMAKLSMIDLAGSERACATGCVGERFKEGANINRSLLSLGNCINRLADGGSYVPYRDSKLTRLLKDSLGGNCKTVMIANVSPSAMSYEDTYNTLKYAARASKIQLTFKKNIVDGNMRVSQYMNIIKELEKRVAELENKIKELKAQLTLSTTKVAKAQVTAKDKAKEELWTQRISETEQNHGVLESKLLALMSQQRVLALRHFLRTRAFEHVANLAHRSSSDALEQICVEEIPRQERAGSNYEKQFALWNSKITILWNKWIESGKKLMSLCNEALSLCPDLNHFIVKIELQSKLRLKEASENLRRKVGLIMKEEIMVSTECMSDTFSMLKKTYLTLKGYGLAPATLTAEYLAIINKAKSAKVISWSDETTEIDPQFQFILTLDLDNPIKSDFNPDTDETNSVNTMTDSDDMLDIENSEPHVTGKRKGTPLKLANNDTIMIDDSLEAFDVMNSAKKKKLDLDNLNVDSTFVLSDNVNAMNNVPNKLDVKDALPARKGLADRTNVIGRSINFNNHSKAKEELWTRRISEAEQNHGVLESKLLALMSQQRVLALRHFLRTRAFEHVANLAHRSSSDALEQICVEEIPRQERAVSNYTKQFAIWNSKITILWNKWIESGKKLKSLCNEALSLCPDLNYFIEKIELQSKLRLKEASENLQRKVGLIMKEEVMVSTECMSDTFSMLKKTYLTLKGYGLAPATLTAEYLAIINKAKSAKVISWSDETTEIDPQFLFILTLDLDNPMKSDFNPDTDETNSVNTMTDSDDMLDIENREPLVIGKRKGTPLKSVNNDTIIIDDSLEAFDVMNSAKKKKLDLDNMNVDNLDSTFVLPDNVNAMSNVPKKVDVKYELPARKGLADRTNVIGRSINFNNYSKARIVKPVAPVRRVAAAAPMPRGPAFGSSLARDGTNLQRTMQAKACGPVRPINNERSVGFKAVRGRERIQPHPYSRPGFNTRK